MKMARWFANVALCGAFFIPLSTVGSARAEVYEGPTDVTVDAEVYRADDGIADKTEFAIQGGALVAGGNSRSVAATGLTRFLARRGHNEISAVVAINYARTARENDAGDEIGWETTVENYQGRLRYDYFWTKNLSTFLAVQARRDRFQGLNLRLGVDPGVSFYFVRNDAQLFWTEAGYDFQYDVLTQETIDAGVLAGDPRDRTETDHNARLYVGYDHKLGERLAFLAGLEFFKSFVNGPSYRVNFNAELQTQLVQRLSLAIGSTTMYNNTPLPDIEKLDVTTSLNLVYSFF